MKRIHLSSTALIAALALTACGSDPLAPSGRGSLSASSINAAIGVRIFTGNPSATSQSCTAETMSETSTYIVAYGGLLPACPPSDSSGSAIPPASSDTVGSKPPAP